MGSSSPFISINPSRGHIEAKHILGFMDAKDGHERPGPHVPVSSFKLFETNPMGNGEDSGGCCRDSTRNRRKVSGGGNSGCRSSGSRGCCCRSSRSSWCGHSVLGWFICGGGAISHSPS